jgi:ABC-type xylose transport system permease subunit
MIERWDYWANVTSIYTFTASGEAQLQAFISLNQQHRYLLGAIVLFYIGLQTVSNSSFTAASTLQNLVSSASSFSKAETKHTEVMVDETAKNENLRANRDDE